MNTQTQTSPDRVDEKGVYRPEHHVRIVTSASLFDGHDAAINIMRRILQRSGAEIIHLGHNRSVDEIVRCALQEDVQGIAITSYQGGHMEFFRYMRELLDAAGAEHIQIVGGGGGTILPSEIKALEEENVARIYSPDDGRAMGLQGMINDVLQRCDFELGAGKGLARLITMVENDSERYADLVEDAARRAASAKTPVLGITGTGGSGKSSLVDELIRRFLLATDGTDERIGVISVDPSKRKTGGALLGDRIRMNALRSPRVFMRSLATRQANLALSRHVQTAVDLMKADGFALVILETSGIGQSDTEIVDHADVTLYVMTPEYGAATQLEKIDMLDFADVIALNKFDKRGGLDALRDVCKQYQRNHDRWDDPLDDMPVVGTMASQFNDVGVNELWGKLAALLGLERNAEAAESAEDAAPSSNGGAAGESPQAIIPPARQRYLSEISEGIRAYDAQVLAQAETARVAGAFATLETYYKDERKSSADMVGEFATSKDKQLRRLTPANQRALETWDEQLDRYRADEYVYTVRGRDIRVPTATTSLSGSRIPRIALPTYSDWGDRLTWLAQENFPGSFPFTAGVFPFKRQGEDPTRMFAGEGGPERTNRRFHYLSKGLPAARLSTAFDSVTLYGEDPAVRPDIYGKVGNSGVSICSLDDAKRLYSGFDLTAASTSVSMTINGPAAAITAFFMNAAIDQECEKYIAEHGLGDAVEAAFAKTYDARDIPRPTYRGVLPEGHSGLGLMLLGLTGDQVLDAEAYANCRKKALTSVRGTVQADILKEDQAQNTCIFSTEFALRLMGDMQEAFIREGVRNFYSVSVSGYHIAEAGANPITQLAFTLANGFTFVEYYLSRGMAIDDFAPNLSFFFSNGLDPEYAVIGRVARRIWAKAMRERYGANERSQMLKYHIQTSGRSLHAQEISFNDIRTTLQALYAIYDNCNSLHTNAYDEAITTPTEESVRRALAIQLIINHELGLARNENPLQGAFVIQELTDLVEQAVLLEFDRLTERGGVLGAMESMYQRGNIQEESMHYEMLKHTGELPVIGVNTFKGPDGSPTVTPNEVIRADAGEKDAQIKRLEQLHAAHRKEASVAVANLKRAALHGANLFDALLDAGKVCSLGETTAALYQVGGEYRRNM